MKYLVPSVICIALVVCIGFVGCSQGGGSTTTTSQTTTQPTPTPVDPLAERLADITFFSTTGTALALDKAKVPVEKLCEVREYVDAVRLLLVTPGTPDFDGARKLVVAKLPEGTRTVGLAIVDIVERYVPRNLPKIDGRNADYMRMAAAALDGVVRGIDRYEMLTPTTRPAN